ncbi:MAG: hypothetical protein ACRC2V_00810, partial [Xenococcaceae cyanobacterium]
QFITNRYLVKDLSWGRATRIFQRKSEKRKIEDLIKKVKSPSEKADYERILEVLKIVYLRSF